VVSSDASTGKAVKDMEAPAGTFESVMTYFVTCFEQQQQQAAGLLDVIVSSDGRSPASHNVLTLT
jgi:hypothetical protein